MYSLNENDLERLVQDIFLFKKKNCPSLGLLDTLVEFNYKNNMNIEELGDLLSEHKYFKDILKNNLIEEGYIREDKNEIDIDEQEW